MGRSLSTQKRNGGRAPLAVVVRGVGEGAVGAWVTNYRGLAPGRARTTLSY